MEINGKCKETELVLVRYTVNFRPGMVFCETFKRGDYDYERMCREAYESHNHPCSLHLNAVKVVKIEDGWR